MNLFGKLLIGLVVGVVASTLTTLLREGELVDVMLLSAFCLATLATALLVGLIGESRRVEPHPARSGSSRAPTPGKPAPRPAASDAARERGKVKWFNASKGFGFIIRENGEEIFVHFRSIRGEGRRGLRDGQAVSFVVAQSDKGPQAEDVEPVE